MVDLGLPRLQTERDRCCQIAAERRLGKLLVQVLEVVALEPVPDDEPRAQRRGVLDEPRQLTERSGAGRAEVERTRKRVADVAGNRSLARDARAVGERISDERHLQRYGFVRTARVVEPVFVGGIHRILARFVAMHRRRQRDAAENGKHAAIGAGKGERVDADVPEEHYCVDAPRTEVTDYLQAIPGIDRSTGSACGPLLRRRRNRNGEIELGREDRNAERPESEREFRPRRARQQQRQDQNHCQRDRKGDSDGIRAGERAGHAGFRHAVRGDPGAVDGAEHDYCFGHPTTDHHAESLTDHHRQSLEGLSDRRAAATAPPMTR